MKRGFVIGVLAVVAFAVILVARMPASWVVPSPPARIGCASVEGSLWNGLCAGLVFQGKTLGEVRWSLHPLQLLTGRVEAQVVVNRASGTNQPANAQGDVEISFSGNNITAHDVKADVPLDDEIRALLNINYLGNIHADLKSVRATGNSLQEIQGVLEAHDLREPRGFNFGGYSLTFPGGRGEQVGQLHDLGGGPMSVQGTVRITNPAGIVVQGLVAPGPNAPQSLQNELRMLGSPDPQGRRMFSFETTF